MKKVILLPATIITNGCWWLKRSNEKDREEDHYESLKKWLENTDFDIVFCENSGADLEFLKPLIEQHPDRVELISYTGNDYDRSFGKGHGELKTIAYAIEKSEKLKSQNIIHKVSGRYFLSNIPNIIKHLEQEKIDESFDLILYYHPPMFETYIIPSVYFGISRKTFEKHMKNAVVNDAAGIYLEHALFNVFSQTPKNKICFIEAMGLDPNQKTGTTNETISHLK
jgi:hypothetical protein